MNRPHCWQDNLLFNLRAYIPREGVCYDAPKVLHLFLFVFLFLSALHTKMYAEGSKELYPAGATGNRAYLYSNSYTGSSGSTSTSWPFKTLGTHYVYARAGEVIAVASSAQNLGNGRIRLTAPDGQQYITAANNTGKIASRTEELAGPRYPGQAAGGNRYAPFTQTVGSGQQGVWKIEFLPTGNEESTATPSVANDAANANWTQNSNTELICAWDVSVWDTNNSTWVTGRVYTNVFNLHISGSQFQAANAFYGKLYVLTKDGIAYRVTNNGNNGVGFTFFVNNRGFLDTSGNSLYKSLDLSDPANSQFRVYDPRSADDATNVTHKIFYSAPSSDLPSSAVQAVSTSSQTSTWLKNTLVTPVASNVTYTGVEGTPNLSGNKGAHIGFDSNIAGSYRIEITIPGYTTRILTGSTSVGTNTIFWDGKDGTGGTLPAATTISELKVQLFGAEVHFPFIDMEINPGGVIIEQLDADYLLFSPAKDLVYWDDSSVSGGSASTRPNPLASGNAGIASNGNGHKWGTYTSGSSGSGNSGTGASSFGNVKSLDTWSFVPGNMVVVPLNIVIASADLEVESVTPSTATVNVGGSLNYSVIVKNNGPSDVTAAGFAFNVPAGFTITNVSYVTANGTVVVVNGTIDPVTGDYTANLDMTNGAEVVFTITGTIGTVWGGTPMTVEASIIRPNDVTDPDATNPTLTPPVDPHIECLNGTAVENCNNIAYNTITPAAIANLTLVKTTDTANPTIGQQVTFTVNVTNNGPSDATGVSVSDQLPNGFTYVSSIVNTGAYNNVTGVWNIGTLANGVTSSMTVTATVNATGNYTNIATVTASQNDPVPGDNSDDATSAPNPEANLGIEKTVDNLTPNVGAQVVFTLTATNNGPGNATNVVVTDQLPSGYTYVSHTIGSYVPATGLWTVGNLANGASATLTITATVNPTGDYTNTASIDSSEIDPEPTDDDDSVTLTPTNIIIANNDTASNINGYTGAANVVNVLTNDTLNGVAVTPSQVTVAEGSGDTDELTINANGSVDVAPNTPAGTYTLNYTLCEVLNPANCDNATVTVTVIPAVIEANNDTASNINGYTGATNVVNVLTNDTLNGVAIIPAEVTITLVGGDAELVLDTTDGSVDVSPNTSAGTYTLNYTLCEVLNPANCDNATVTVTVIPAVIEANNDTASNVNGYTGAANVVNVLTNDTLNGIAVTPSQVTVTEGSGDTDELTINTNGSVDVAPNTPAGTYTLNYTLCEVLNPANCDNATVTVTVIPAVIEANNDAASNINGYTGAANVVNVLTNDTLNGVAVTPSQVTVTEGSGDTDELTINTNGSVDVAPNTPAGTYTLNYTLCEVLNPANCDNATMTVTVIPAVIEANNDTASNINGYIGATNVVNVLTNDTLNGVAVILSQVTVTEGSGDTDELTINANGSVDVAANTPAGTYTLNYTLCEVLNPANCDNATVTVTVIPAVIEAVNDTASNINGYTGAANVVNVLTNDALNGVAVIPSQVTVTEGSGDTNELTINANGSVDVAPNTPAGTYTLNYTLCEALNPANCDNATVTVTVIPAVIEANNDTASNINGYTGAANVVNVLTNDTLNSVAVIPAEVTITLVGGDAELVLDTTDGSVDVAANTPGGTYTITYQVCEVLNPTNCETATVSIFVMTPQLTLTKDVQNGTFDSVGDIITYNIVLTNTGNVDVTDITVTDENADSITPSAIATIIPGATINIVATHTITQADLDRGYVYNMAAVEGNDPTGAPVGDDSSDPTEPLQPGDPGYNSECPDCTVTTITQMPALTLTKDAQAGTYDSVGDVITYDIVLTNSGNVTITDMVVTDVNADTLTPANITTLAPGTSVTITATHVVTQSDLDAGFVYNSAQVTGNDPIGNPVTDESSDPTNPTQPGGPGHNSECPDCTVTTITQLPALILTKDAQAGTYDSVGDVITYDIMLTNSGNVTITDMVVTDANADTLTPANVTTLAPGASVTITATHVVTQSDLDAGFVYNSAQVTGNDPTGNPVTDESSDPTDPAQPGDTGYDPACPDCTISSMTQQPEMKLFKEAVYQDTNGDGKVNPGDSILYTFTVQNTGNTTISDITIEDPLVTVNGGPLASLAPGASDATTFSALHTITQADVEEGAVYNLAWVDGTDSMGNPINTESQDPTPMGQDDPSFDPACPDCTVVSLNQTPGMTLVKEARFNDNNNDGRAQAGETITYSFKVVNTGNVALRNIVVTDALPGVVLNGGPIALLEVGQTDTTTYTAIYTITQADINTGMVSNQARAQAETSEGIKLNVLSDDNDALGNDPTITELSGCIIEIFNAISADGNGENDNFYIGGIECYPDNEVYIYNRWGVLVYDVKGYDNNEKSFKGYSDGRATVSNSSSLPAGTYFYIIQYKKADGSAHKKDGYLYITR